ncbi:MAG: hypothetical protein JKX72_06235 [Robiginitomaculum sp.]|nr:hypothetical protein [Robiginitomaculum sp.]
MDSSKTSRGWKTLRRIARQNKSLDRFGTTIKLSNISAPIRREMARMGRELVQ